MITADMTTVVRNVSGRTLTFGCLPRSKELAAGEEHTIDGCLLTRLQGHKRKLAGLNRALTTGLLAIVKSPNIHLYDETLDVTKVVKVDNNTLSATDPSWGAYSSSITDPHTQN